MPGWPRNPCGEGAESVKATETSRWPASIGTRISSASSAVMRYSWSRCPAMSSSGTAISTPGSGPGNCPPISQRVISS